MPTSQVLIDLYAKVGIDLTPMASGLANAPPFGGTLAVGWTDSEFASEVWHERCPNPAAEGKSVRFTSYPHHHGWTARFMVWAFENIDSSIQVRKSRIKCGSSARSRLTYFTALTRFAQSIDKARLVDITQDDLRNFLMQWCGLTGSRELVTRTTAQDHLGFLSKLYHTGPRGEGWVPDGLSFDPKPVVGDIISNPKLRSSQSTGDIQEETARHLLNSAIRWIEDLAAPCLELTELAGTFDSWSVGRTVKDRRQITRYIGLRNLLPSSKPRVRNVLKQSTHAGQQIAAQIQEVVSSREEIMEPAVEVRSGESNYVGHVPEPFSFSGACLKDTKSEMFRTIDYLKYVTAGMCYLITASFGGWRISEVLSVEDGYLQPVAVGFNLGSKVRKTGVDPETVVYRPVPSITAQAVEAMTALNRTLFTSQEKRIFRAAAGQPSRRSHIERALEYACLEAGCSQKILSHQLRRLFARFYLRRFKGNMDAVRWHFRHVSRAMIWAYADDPGNAEFLVREEKAFAMHIAEGIVHGEGYRSKHVANDIGLEYRSLNLPPQQAARWLEEKLSSSFSTVYPTPFGYCLFQRGSVGAACDAQETPVIARAEPLTCGGCMYLVTGEENVPFWTTTALLHQAILRSQYATPLMKVESRKMLGVCRKLLDRHPSVSASMSGK